MVTIPGPGQPDQQELVLNDVVEVPLMYAIEAIEDGKWGDHWTLGYAMTVHSSQGLTIEDQTVWVVDDYLQWSNLAYLTVSRVRYLHQLARCCFHQKRTTHHHQPLTRPQPGKTSAGSSRPTSALTLPRA